MVDSIPGHLKRTYPSGKLFPVQREFNRCVTVLEVTGITTRLPKSGSMGVIGIDWGEYPLPTEEQVVELVAHNRQLIERKILQGFNCLELTPLAMPTALLLDRLKATILERTAGGNIFPTQHFSYDPSTPVRVNTKKTVWVWGTLRQTLDTDDLVYFPQEYSSDPRGQTKLEVINNRRICAVPGWSVGLVENLPILPQPGQARTLGGRRQLEIGLSPRDYLQILQTQAYQGETGKTLEDFAIKFLTHLVGTGEISNDRYDNNSLWFLGQYVKYVEHLKSALVPTGWWHREFGRVRLDAHRPGNKLCTKSWGASTTVRLVRP